MLEIELRRRGYSPYRMILQPIDFTLNDLGVFIAAHGRCLPTHVAYIYVY